MEHLTDGRHCWVSGLSTDEDKTCPFDRRRKRLKSSCGHVASTLLFGTRYDIQSCVIPLLAEACACWTVSNYGWNVAQTDQTRVNELSHGDAAKPRLRSEECLSRAAKLRTIRIEILLVEPVTDEHGGIIIYGP